MSDYTKDFSSININIDFDKWGIREERMAYLPQYIEIGYQKGLDKLIRNTKEKIREQMNLRGLSGSKYANGITVLRDGYNGLQITAMGYMIYVEFGTGIVGKGTHPMPQLSEDFFGWDVNNHGDEGWVYKKVKNFTGLKDKLLDQCYTKLGSMCEGRIL